MSRQIPVYRPDLSGNELRYVIECVDSSWISSIGSFIERFERSVAETVGARHAIAVCNGTVALHLAMHCLGIGPGDEVIVPTFTYISSVNTIVQTGATPVFADCRTNDWLLDPDDVSRRITSRTKAILPVHLYGTGCDMIALRQLAQVHGLFIVEDAAEVFGCMLSDRHLGTIGDAGTFSFFGNKTITTGEGGMVVCNDDALAARLRKAKGQGQSSERRYWHDSFGFNYRMTNICAAIGLAQIERLAEIIERKQAIARRYRDLTATLPVSFQERHGSLTSSEWLVSLLLPPGTDRAQLMKGMAASGVDTRPVFHCAHQMPVYARDEHFPNAEDISSRGISLPSYPQLANDELDRVIEALARGLKQQGFTSGDDATACHG
jgi:perosamine synthetase